MPTYDYKLHATDQVVEVQHRMSESAKTWGELCAISQLPLGDIDPESPVEKLLSASNVVRSGALKNPSAPPCASGGPCCGPAACGV